MTPLADLNSYFMSAGLVDIFQPTASLLHGLLQLSGLRDIVQNAPKDTEGMK